MTKLDWSRWAILVGVLSASACAHKSAANTPAASSDSASAAASAPVAAAAGKSCTRDLDCGDKQLCIRGACVDISADLAECSVLRVHFPFNEAEIAQTDLPLLERSARCLRADRSLHVTIEGNADERGTEDYNLALGDRRATTVAKTLERMGASQQQLRTVSFGEEKPLCAEHDEECWAKNRSAAVKTQGGTKPPAQKSAPPKK